MPLALYLLVILCSVLRTVSRWLNPSNSLQDPFPNKQPRVAAEAIKKSAG